MEAIGKKICMKEEVKVKNRIFRDEKMQSLDLKFGE